MSNSDTIKLLKECDAGSKMAVSSIDDILSKADDKELILLLTESKNHHEKLGNDLHTLLLEYNSEEKEPNVMAKGMSKLRTNVKINMNDCDHTIADLMIDGCDMGIKSLYKYLNQYKAANDRSKELCKKIIDIEYELRNKLYHFL